MTAAEEQNSADRRIALEWIESGPLFDLMLMRLALTVLAPLDHVGLTMSGEAWESEQRHKVERALTEGLPMPEAMARREFRITAAAKGVAEHSAFDRLRYLFDEDAFWTIVPRKYFTEANVSKVFKLLSRLGALIEELWASGNRCLDIQLFRVIHEPDRLAAIRANRHRDYCKYGTFGRMFLDSNVGCTDEEFIVRLCFLATTIRTSMAPVEAGWAYVRRLCKRLGCQTHQQDFGYISALWVLHLFRSRSDHDLTLKEKFQLPRHVRDQRGDDQSGGDDVDDAVDASLGWCGPWRAFVAESDIGQFRDFHTLGEQYRDIKRNDAARFAQLVVLGEEAAARRRAGERPFGPTQRQQLRAAHRDQQAVRAAALSGQMRDGRGPGGDDADVDTRARLAEGIVAFGGSF